MGTKNTRPRSRRGLGRVSSVRKIHGFVNACGPACETRMHTGLGVRNCERRVITIPRAEFNCKSGLRESPAKIRRPPFREE